MTRPEIIAGLRRLAEDYRALGLAAPVKRLIDTLDAASLEIN